VAVAAPEHAVVRVSGAGGGVVDENCGQFEADRPPARRLAFLAEQDLPLSGVDVV
jgi:hypothetical protein